MSGPSFAVPPHSGPTDLPIELQVGNTVDENVPMLTQEQLRHVILSYLDEVSHFYKVQQRQIIEAVDNQADLRLENKASELLLALGVSKDPAERRKAVLQVLCRAMQRQEPDLPS